MKIVYWFDFINDSYLDTNFAPLYHRTTTYGFIDIIQSNTLKITEYDNIYQDDTVKMVSFTSDKKLNLDYYKSFLDVVIEINRDKLKENYKIIKYDFFIHSKKEDKPKSNIHRIEPFEFEEIVIKDISNIDRYIISVNFENNSIMDRNVASLIPLLREKNIKIYNNGYEY